MNYPAYKDWSATSFDPKGTTLRDREGNESTYLQEWKVVGGRTRDSEEGEIDLFDKLSQHLNEEENEEVEIARIRHWAVGWVEVILVKPDSESFEEALEFRENYIYDPEIYEE